MIDLSKVDKIFRYEIGADKNDGFRAVLKGPVVTVPDGTRAPGDLLAEILAQTAPDSQGGTAPRHAPASDLSIEIAAGNNFYLIKLAGVGNAMDTVARFGPGAAPIILLPPDAISSHPFSQFGLYSLRGTAIKHWPHTHIPADPNEVPNDAWIGFVCDHDKLTAFFQAPRFTNHQTLAVPFYFNFYDIKTMAPIWETASHDKKLFKKVETLGGIHPADDDDKGDATTHGGIHPSSLVQYLYV